MKDTRNLGTERRMKGQVTETLFRSLGGRLWVLRSALGRTPTSGVEKSLPNPSNKERQVKKSHSVTKPRRSAKGMIARRVKENVHACKMFGA